MPIQTEVQIAIALANLLFFAGGAWFLVKQNKKEAADLRRDVNGLGQKVREHQALTIALEENPARRIEFCKSFFGKGH
jgi:hypothetical protein